MYLMCIQIIKDDPSGLVFECHPGANPDKVILLITIILVLGVISICLFLKNLQLTDVVLVIAGYLLIIGGLFVYSRLYKITVNIDKDANRLSIFNIITSWTNVLFFWEENPVEIPIPDIKKIEYVPQTPLEPYLFIIARGRLVFILNNNNKVKLYTWGAFASYKNYGKIGQKIADYIHVPFEI